MQRPGLASSKRTRAEGLENGGLAGSSVERDSEARHLPPEGGRRDGEELGGLLAAAVALTERGLDRPPLGGVDHVGERAPSGGGGGGGGGGGEEVIGRDHAALNERRRLLDHVLELPDVPGEVVVIEGVEDRLVEARADADLAVV